MTGHVCAILVRVSAWARRRRVKTAKISRTAGYLVYRQNGNIFPGHFLPPTFGPPPPGTFMHTIFAPHPSWAPVFLTSELINTSCIFQLLLWLFSQDSLNFVAVTVQQMNALTSDAAQNAVTLTARRDLRVFPRLTWRCFFVITTGMGNARDEPLIYEATCMSGDVMSVHPTTIRDTWLVVIHHSISRRCYKKCFERSFGKNVCVNHMVTWNSTPSPRPAGRFAAYEVFTRS